MQAAFEVADVLQGLGSGVENLGLNPWQLRTLRAIRNCRTAALGGHVDACDGCANISISYNSCRNRHCPKCQAHNREKWIAAREKELLPVPYFHVVFTLPDGINALAMHSPKLVYDLLFESAWETMRSFGNNKAVQMGMIALLHTWGQNLCLHPHLHCIVPGGGIVNKTWQNIRADGKFLFPVKALSKVFRAKFCAKLKQSAPDQYSPIRQQLWKNNWVVYSKKPFGSPQAVVEYLGRYSHKIAISNHRIKNVDEQYVTFDYKDYRQAACKKQMMLTHTEFIRRFALHILPKGFVKIRHYGFLSSTWKRQKLPELQMRLKMEWIPKATNPPTALRKCPCCKSGNLLTILVFDKRGPPAHFLGARQNSIACKS